MERRFFAPPPPPKTVAIISTGQRKPLKVHGKSRCRTMTTPDNCGVPRCEHNPTVTRNRSSVALPKVPFTVAENLFL